MYSNDQINNASVHQRILQVQNQVNNSGQTQCRKYHKQIQNREKVIVILMYHASTACAPAWLPAPDYILLHEDRQFLLF